ncbi:hypothetical protein NDU88_003547 [Pleurodeles waltl]|uniref:Uncharacterized protein n=1 Tax=Pleurodeles waltl TaxID=8319 RepID=A0AAV7NKZ7_PLEWA|nr:hypothetical protein NDU88_003547 [Pleurodeles waltl]
MLRHLQARQLLQVAQTQGPLRLGSLEIRISADFSKETTDRRRAFPSLRAQLRRLDVKFGVFEPARMWITKNGKSQNFYNPEDLQAFLESLQDQMQGQTQSMETTSQTTQPARGPPSGASRPAPASELEVRSTIDPQTRGRDLERLANSYDDRGQVLQAVAMHTQLSDRDKSCSPLIPTMDPT